MVILNYTLIISIILLVMFLLICFVSKSEYETKQCLKLPVSADQIMQMLADVETYPQWKKNLKKIEILKKNEDVILFREHYFTKKITYELNRYSDKMMLTLNLVKADFPLQCNWVFQCKNTVGHDGCELEISEHQKILSFWAKGVVYFIGHDYILHELIRNIRKSVQKKIIAPAF